MKITMDQLIQNKEKMCNLGCVRKELDTDCIPLPGMEIEDLAWKESQPIKRVVLNPDDNSYYINVPDRILPDASFFEEEVKMYESHGWTALGRNR